MLANDCSYLKAEDVLLFLFMYFNPPSLRELYAVKMSIDLEKMSPILASIGNPNKD